MDTEEQPETSTASLLDRIAAMSDWQRHLTLAYLTGRDALMVELAVSRQERHNAVEAALKAGDLEP